MTQAAWAEATARRFLEPSLPRRWAHTQGVAAAARTLAPVLGPDGDLLTAAAWLHDIGYAPDVTDTGFHPLDGARHLRDAEGANGMLCRLVAHHSCAVNEAAERGLARDLITEFRPARRDLADALTYWDMTTSPDGHRLPIEQRLAEIRSRYGPDHLVSRTIGRSEPQLTRAVTRVTGRLAACSPPAAPASPDRDRVGSAAV
jgi:HD domain